MLRILEIEADKFMYNKEKQNIFMMLRIRYLKLEQAGSLHQKLFKIYLIILM